MNNFLFQISPLFFIIAEVFLLVLAIWLGWGLRASVTYEEVDVEQEKADARLAVWSDE